MVIDDKQNDQKMEITFLKTVYNISYIGNTQKFKIIFIIYCYFYQQPKIYSVIVTPDDFSNS